MKALVINGPNLNMLGIREPGIYGSDNYDRLVQICQEAGAAQGFDEVEVFQSNHEVFVSSSGFQLRQRFFSHVARKGFRFGKGVPLSLFGFAS